MPYTILTCEQRSQEWHEARRGRLTASVAGEMLATIKTGEAAARRNLRIRLVLERLTGKVQERGFVSQSMQDGIDREAEARAYYEMLTGDAVENTGFIRHDDWMVGCSLDGCVFEDGRIVKILELKSPEPSAHLSYLRTGQIGKDYEAQVLHSLWLTGAESCDWMSYQPEFPEHLRAKRITITRNEAAIADYEAKALAFLAEVERECEELRRMAAV
jgi:predicted phage-related endonuclease